MCFIAHQGDNLLVQTVKVCQLLDLKLSDFDGVMIIGEEIVVLTESFWWLLIRKIADALASMAKQMLGQGILPLALSITPCSMVETETWGKDHFVVLSHKFSHLCPIPPKTLLYASAGMESTNCLLAEFLGDAEQDERFVEDHHWLEIQKKECKAFVQNGFVDTLDRF